MTLQEFIPPRRLLLGPGPSLVHPRVLRALSTPLLGHLDPVFLTVMNDIQSLLRIVSSRPNIALLSLFPEQALPEWKRRL